jgi:hypothetical protein
MTREKFMFLSEVERAAFLWHAGRFLDSVNYYRYKAYLYSIEGFFVEVLCYQGSTEIESIDVASEESMLKFLNRIQINELYAI